MRSEQSVGCEMKESTWFDFVVDFKLEICLLAYSAYCIFQLLWLVIVEVSAFKSIFQAMNVELPVLTRFLLSLSDIFNEYWFILVPAGLGIIVNSALFSLLWFKVKEFKFNKSIMETVPFLSLVVTILVLSGMYKLALWSMYLPMIKLVNYVG